MATASSHSDDCTSAKDATDNGWKELMGKDLMMKSLVPSSETPALGIQHQDLVLIDFVGRQAASPDDTDGPIFQEAENWWVVVGDKDVVPGLEMGIRFGHVGETIAVWSHSKFAYGISTRRHYNVSNNNKDGDTASNISGEQGGAGTPSSSLNYYELPPQSNVRYEVTIKQLVSTQERTENSFHWILTAAESKKNIGNDAYAYEWSNGQGKSRIKYIYEKAAKELQFVVDSMNGENDDDGAKASTKDKAGEEAKENDSKTTSPSSPSSPENDENDDPGKPKDDQKLLLREKTSSMLVDCLNNIVAVHLRAKEYHAAKEAAVKVLQRDPDNFKGLIRAAKAALLDPASSYEEVNAAIKAAAEKATGVQESDLAALRMDFQRRKHAYEQKSREMYSKALGGPGKRDSVPDQSMLPTTDDSNGSAIATADTSDKNASVSPKTPGSTETVPDLGNGEKSFSWSDLSTWPWSSILAYIFQLALPFVMWTIAQQFRADRPIVTATSMTTEPEGEFEFPATSPDFEIPGTAPGGDFSGEEF
ncbi:hypothetical protein ACA910_020027 [Epithemia clementina (nom. ined.)]